MRFAIIGGSGLDSLSLLEGAAELNPTTPFGQASAPLLRGLLAGVPVLFLARHGRGHTIPPHRINYRANIAALASAGVTDVIAVTAVGGISNTAPPGRIVIPDQIIDYTHSREQSFFDGMDRQVEHVDFTSPFCGKLRAQLIAAASALGMTLEPRGVYGATQGPRLETAAEIKRMAGDGCSIVGMTGMPEAALAREAGLNYANCSLVVNWAAGTHDDVISIDEINRQLHSGMEDVKSLLLECLRET